MKASILVDEINAMSTFHHLGIEGIKPWISFFDAIKSALELEYKDCTVEYNLYGAIIPKSLDIKRHHSRRLFFEALGKHGIQVHRGYCLQNPNTEEGYSEKGVDMLLGLDLHEKSLEGYDLLIVFSGDSDIVPAIERAKRKSNVKVVAVLSKLQRAQLVRDCVDSVLYVEDVINLINPQHVIKREIPIF